jgi:hypothetical protein
VVVVVPALTHRKDADQQVLSRATPPAEKQRVEEIRTIGSISAKLRDSNPKVQFLQIYCENQMEFSKNSIFRLYFPNMTHKIEIYIMRLKSM